MDVSYHNKLRIVWGDKQTISVPKDAQEFPQHCALLADSLNLKRLVILAQNHKTTGHMVDDTFSLGASVFEKSGDWLMTSAPLEGIAVLTADCLPVIFYDPEHRVVAIAHAGWRGTVANIFNVVLGAMEMQAGTNFSHVEIFFGPAAQSCCYEVSEDFVDNVPKQYQRNDFLVERDNKIFFDNATLAKCMLMDAGVLLKNIDESNNICTMCSNAFYSARRDKSLKRNISIVSMVL